MGPQNGRLASGVPPLLCPRVPYIDPALDLLSIGPRLGASCQRWRGGVELLSPGSA